MRRGFLSIATLVNVILVITAFMIIAGFLTYITLKQNDSQKEEICRNSIRAKMASKFSIGGFSLKLGDLCTTIDKTVDSKDKEEVKRFIADKAARCWWMYGEGEYEDLFGHTDINIGRKNRCAICYTIKTKGDFGEISGRELSDFMLTNDYTKSDRSYMEYIQMGKGPGNIMVLSDIRPREIYAVSFATKTKDCEWCKSAALGGAAIGAGGLVMTTIASGGTLLIAGGLLAAGGAAAETISVSSGLSKLLQNRDTSTVYISRLKSLNDEQYCERVEGR